MLRDIDLSLPSRIDAAQLAVKSAAYIILPFDRPRRAVIATATALLWGPGPWVRSRRGPLIATQPFSAVQISYLVREGPRERSF